MHLEMLRIEVNGITISHRVLVFNSFQMVTYIKANLKMDIKVEEENCHGEMGWFMMEIFILDICGVMVDLQKVKEFIKENFREESRLDKISQ